VRHHIIGLSQQNRHENGQLEGLFLVRVERGIYRRHRQKPFFSVYFVVLEPRETEGRRFCARLYCTPKALWRLDWFLRDFGYDRELIERDNVDEKALIGLRVVVRTSVLRTERPQFVNLEGFTPASQWEERSTAIAKPVDLEVRSDI
jgi:hypothetical protein